MPSLGEWEFRFFFSVEELEEAEIAIIRLQQKQFLVKQMKRIQQGVAVEKHDWVPSLKRFIGKHSSRGWLQNQELRRHFWSKFEGNYLNFLQKQHNQEASKAVGLKTEGGIGRHVLRT